MLWVEIDQATGQRRLHTAESLAARFTALGVDSTKWHAEVKRSWFRQARGDDKESPSAQPNGSWGIIAAFPVCSVCKGTGSVSYSDDLSRAVEKCWKCGGKKVAGPYN